MVPRVTSVCLALVLVVGVVAAQNFEPRGASLQNMIDYTQQFYNERGTPADPQPDPVQSGKIRDDPFIQSLFKEFLVQYQQLAQEEQTQTPAATTSPRNFLNPTQKPQQRRRPTANRRINSPQASRANNGLPSTTPFPSNPSGQTFAQQEATSQSLRNKYFGVNNNQETRKPKIQKPQRIFQNFNSVQTTPAPQPIELQEVIVPTQPPKPIQPRFVGIQNKPLPKKTTNNKVQTSEFDEKEFRRQANSAKYEFASDIDDEINGNLHQREEVRDGNTVRGRYSYSDGFYKRTVHYEADDKGYRVTNEEVVPLEGPQGNPNGQAKVSSYVDGRANNYQITQDDIAKKNQKTTYNYVGQDEEFFDY